MEEYPEPQEEMNTTEPSSEVSGAQSGPWIAVFAALLVIAALAFAYAHQQHTKASQMASQANEMHATISQLQNEVNTLDAKLNQMSAEQAATAAAPPAAPPAPAPAPIAVAPKPRRTVALKRRTQPNSSLKQMQARLDTQQKQLSAIEDEVAKTRTDFQGNLNSTRDELNGSIAKNHDELVALEKRGERNYFEFDLAKSKQFQRSGPLMLSLRKADTKHNSYDLAMIVDDNQITKKHVSLYEPISLHEGDDLQPVQLVVNQIDKNHVHGYISAPKYAETRQANAVTVPASAPPASRTPSDAAANTQ